METRGMDGNAIAVTQPDNSNLAPGDVVSGLEPSELVEIQRVVPFGNKTLVEGVGLQSRRMVKRPLAAEELAGLVKVRGQQHTFDGDARLFLFGAGEGLIRLSHVTGVEFLARQEGWPMAASGSHRDFAVIAEVHKPSVYGFARRSLARSIGSV